MADLITMLSAVAGQQGEEADEDFNQTVLLLHGDGTNGAQNNTFLDSSTNNFTITRNGNTTQGTFSPFSVGAGQWSNFFDGSGDYLSTTSTTIGNFGTGDFTVEYWFNPSVYTTTINHLDFRGAAGTGGALRISTFSSQSNKIVVGWDNSDTQLISAAAQPLGSWTHVAVTRSGTTVRLFVNGVLDATTTSAYSMPDAGLLVGTYTGGGAFPSWFHGYISNIRVVKGTAVYTAAFTPPTAPLTAITNTSLLTCQSNRFVDNSTNAFAITRNGDVRVTPFSPFAPTAAYSAGTNGGSGYFDGTGDWIELADNTAFTLTNDFTIECWFYQTGAYADYRVLFNKWDSGAQEFSILSDASGRLRFAWGAFNTNIATSPLLLTSSNIFTLNSWNHLAVVRNSNTFTMYLNGVSVASASFSTGASDFTQPLLIGSYAGGSSFFAGYISNARIVKGTAVYTSAFTPPTAPLTAITNTSLLCNFTNAGIFDNTGKNNLETVGNAQIDTTTKKYGTGSLEFDGTGDWLLMPNNPDQQLGTGNFTIEFWVYLASGDTGSARGLVAKGGASTGWLVSLDSSQKVVFTYTTSTITSSGAITTNAWNHIAVVRSGTGSNQTKIYISGTNDGTGTVSTDFNQTESMYVGANRTGGDPMKGFIDDLRITKGVARYTANFTAPTKAFPDQ